MFTAVCVRGMWDIESGGEECRGFIGLSCLSGGCWVEGCCCWCGAGGWGRRDASRRVGRKVSAGAKSRGTLWIQAYLYVGTIAWMFYLLLNARRFRVEEIDSFSISTWFS